MLMSDLLRQYGIIWPRDLSRVLGCSRQSASMYLHGKTDIPRDALLILHVKKGIPLDLLVGAKRKLVLPRLGRPPKIRSV